MGPFYKKKSVSYLFSSYNTHRSLIEFTTDADAPNWHGYLYAVLLFVVAVIRSLLLHQYFHRSFTVGMNMRSAIVSAVYKKVQ